MLLQPRNLIFVSVLLQLPMTAAASEAPDSPASAAPGQAVVLFDDISASAGIDFRHENGATEQKFMAETIGAGGLFFDYDNDGWLDIFLVNGGSFVDPELERASRNRLYRNKGDGTFAAVDADLDGSGYRMGACAGDFDNDGRVDLYLTGVGANHLYHNLGDGSFADVTASAGVTAPVWSASCAFGDIDNDGDLDLYVVNYVDFAVDNNKYCGSRGENRRAYCHPNVYNGLADVLYRNDGGGKFTDITADAGVHNPDGKGLGIVMSDYDRDGWLDIYVANDSVPNFLFRNKGGGKFEDVSLWAGVMVNGEGEPEAGMGTDMADYDGDGWPDIFVTNLDMETNTLYRNTGEGWFEDVTAEAGLAEPSRRFVGFGTAFFDYDNDTDLDLIVANGHVLDNVSSMRDSITYEQQNLLFRHDANGLFTSVADASGPGLALEKVGRGLAVGDIDNDGDLDVLVANNGQTADLLRNDGGNQGNSLLIRLVGSASNRDGVGARLALTVDGKAQLREVKAGSSYLGQNDLRQHFGLGRHAGAERLEIHWPGGKTEVFENLPANHIVTIREGDGIVERVAFSQSGDS
jgi:hypothetical protein